MNRLGPATLIVIIVAILLGAAGAYGVRQHLRTPPPQAVVAPPAPPAKIYRVPIALIDLPAGRNGSAPTEPPERAEPATVTPLRPAADEDGPAVLPGYQDMTIPQLRGRLRHLGVDDLRAAVRCARGRALLEASGGVTLTNVRAVAETGVDRISVGALTHSAPALDLSMLVEPD